MTDAFVINTRISGELLRSAFAQGRDFAEYCDWIVSSGDAVRRSMGAQLRELYEEVTFTDEERTRLEGIAGRFRILAMVDVGCPDVVANLPIVARITEVNPRIELAMLHRPDHMGIAYAIAEVYPGTDGLTHVPSYLLIDENDNDVSALLERPNDVTKLTAPRKAASYRLWHDIFPSVGPGDLPEDYRIEFYRDYGTWRRGLLDIERAGVVEWLVNAAAGRR